MSDQVTITQDGDATIVVLPPGQSAVYTDDAGDHAVTGVLVVESTPGPRGERGLDGRPGDVGQQGETGPIGPIGPQGLMGATGKMGKSGPPGVQGRQGRDGPQGRTGDTGRTGERGPEGPIGKAGETGSQGLPGVRGERGERGDDGADGLSAYELAVRRKAMVASAKPALTETAWIKSLKGAKGDLGPVGPRGEKGEQGKRGEQGEVGKQGPRGLNGEGRFGSQGAPGPPGAPGPTGPPGPGFQLTLVARENIPAFSAVAIDSAGLAYLPDKDTLADAERVAGVATVAALTGESFVALTDGTLLASSGPWVTGPLYVGDLGALTSVPPSAAYQLQMGTAVTNSAVVVRPQFPIYLT